VSILIVFLALPFFASSQSGRQRLLELYDFVDKTDSLSNKSQQTFYLEKFLKNDDNYREKWRYATNEGKIVFFEIDFIVDSTEFTEVYYVNRGNLICSEEYEKINYSYLEDELKKGGVYYFNGTIPQHVVMLGDEYKARNAISPDLAVLQRFEKRYTELKRHIPMLP
jgi:hypothetical protein